MVSLDPLRVRKVCEANTASISALIESAIEKGIRNAVGVSSHSAFLWPGALGIQENSPPGEPRDTYRRYKNYCGKLVRRWRAAAYLFPG